MRLKALKCGNCGDIIFSRTGDDYRECTCGAVAMSGGQNYPKYIIAPGSPSKKMKLEVDVTIDTLYEDWKHMRDKHGLIRPDRPMEHMRLRKYVV